MPVNRKKMAAMKEQYGSAKGERAYFAVEQKEKGRKGKKGKGRPKKGNPINRALGV